MGSKNMLEPQIYYFQDRGDAASPGFELPIIFGTDNVNDTGQLKKKNSLLSSACSQWGCIMSLNCTTLLLDTISYCLLNV